MPFELHPPTLALRPFVRAYWMYSNHGEQTAGEVERIVADGCAEIVIHLGDEFSEWSGDRFATQPRALFAGQLTRPLLLAPGRNIDVMGVRFEPAGARRFGLRRQSIFTDRRWAVEDLLSRERLVWWRATLDRVASAATSQMRIEAMEDFLYKGLAAAASPTPDATDACVSMIASAGGCGDLSAIATKASLSRRQLQRRFLDDVGVGPKLFSRIVRFQRVFDRTQFGTVDWAQVALSCGYFDQPHLLRDFRQFAGEPPRSLLESRAPLTAAFSVHRG